MCTYMIPGILVGAFRSQPSDFVPSKTGFVVSVAFRVTTRVVSANFAVGGGAYGLIAAVAYTGRCVLYSHQ